MTATLKAAALISSHTIYWNFKEEVCLTALHYIGKLVIYEMLCLALYRAVNYSQQPQRSVYNTKS